MSQRLRPELIHADNIRALLVVKPLAYELVDVLAAPVIGIYLNQGLRSVATFVVFAVDGARYVFGRISGEAPRKCGVARDDFLSELKDIRHFDQRRGGEESSKPSAIMREFSRELIYLERNLAPPRLLGFGRAVPLLGNWPSTGGPPPVVGHEGPLTIHPPRVVGVPVRRRRNLQRVDDFPQGFEARKTIRVAADLADNPARSS